MSKHSALATAAAAFGTAGPIIGFVLGCVLGWHRIHQQQAVEQDRKAAPLTTQVVRGFRHQRQDGR